MPGPVVAASTRSLPVTSPGGGARMRIVWSPDRRAALASASAPWTAAAVVGEAGAAGAGAVAAAPVERATGAASTAGTSTSRCSRK